MLRKSPICRWIGAVTAAGIPSKACPSNRERLVRVAHHTLPSGATSSDVSGVSGRPSSTVHQRIANSRVGSSFDPAAHVGRGDRAATDRADASIPAAVSSAPKVAWRVALFGMVITVLPPAHRGDTTAGGQSRAPGFRCLSRLSHKLRLDVPGGGELRKNDHSGFAVVPEGGVSLMHRPTTLVRW